MPENPITVKLCSIALAAVCLWFGTVAAKHGIQAIRDKSFDNYEGPAAQLWGARIAFFGLFIIVFGLAIVYFAFSF